MKGSVFVESEHASFGRGRGLMFNGFALLASSQNTEFQLPRAKGDSGRPTDFMRQQWGCEVEQGRLVRFSGERMTLELQGKARGRERSLVMDQADPFAGCQNSWAPCPRKQYPKES
jgi:hypothetical protein